MISNVSLLEFLLGHRSLIEKTTILLWKSFYKKFLKPIFRNVNVTLLCITSTPTMRYTTAWPEKWSSFGGWVFWIFWNRPCYLWSISEIILPDWPVRKNNFRNWPLVAYHSLFSSWRNKKLDFVKFLRPSCPRRQILNTGWHETRHCIEVITALSFRRVRSSRSMAQVCVCRFAPRASSCL